MLLNRLEHAGLPAPERQYRFCPTRRWRADFAFPSVLLLIEVDGGTWTGGRHTRGAGFEADCEKLSTAAAMGWRVIRVTGRMIEDGRAVMLIRQALIESGGATAMIDGAEWICLRCDKPFWMTAEDQAEADRRRREQLTPRDKTSLEMFCPACRALPAGPDDEHAQQIAEIRWINQTGRVMTSEVFRNHVTWLLAEVDRLTQDLAAARASEARLAEWVAEEGGWRLFYYASTPPPDDTFDLTDRINPEVSERLRVLLTDQEARS